MILTTSWKTKEGLTKFLSNYFQKEFQEFHALFCAYDFSNKHTQNIRALKYICKCVVKNIQLCQCRTNTVLFHSDVPHDIQLDSHVFRALTEFFIMIYSVSGGVKACLTCPVSEVFFFPLWYWR